MTKQNRRTIPAQIVVDHGEGWLILWDRFAGDFIAQIEHDLDMRAIAFCRTQTEARSAIRDYRFESLKVAA